MMSSIRIKTQEKNFNKWLLSRNWIAVVGLTLIAYSMQLLTVLIRYSRIVMQPTEAAQEQVVKQFTDDLAKIFAGKCRHV